MRALASSFKSPYVTSLFFKSATTRMDHRSQGDHRASMVDGFAVTSPEGSPPLDRPITSGATVGVHPNGDCGPATGVHPEINRGALA